MIKKVLLYIFLVSLSTQIVYADCVIQNSKQKVTISNSKSCNSDLQFKKEDYPQEALRYKKYIMQLQMDRATVYNALNLTDEQIQLKEKLVNENAPIYEEKFDQLIKESLKLKVLEEANASSSDIKSQKKVIKKIKKEIEKIVEKENKTFTKSLTSLQRTKYNLIKKLEKNDYKQAEHRKDYYKSNPQMRPFGDPAKYACPIGREE